MLVLVFVCLRKTANVATKMLDKDRCQQIKLFEWIWED